MVVNIVKLCQTVSYGFPFIPFLLHSSVKVWNLRPDFALGDVLFTGRLVTDQMVSLGHGILEALAGYVGKPANSLMNCGQLDKSDTARQEAKQQNMFPFLLSCLSLD